MGGFTKCQVDLREIDYKLNKKLTIINAYLYYSNEDQNLNINIYNRFLN